MVLAILVGHGHWFVPRTLILPTQVDHQGQQKSCVYKITVYIYMYVTMFFYIYHYSYNMHYICMCMNDLEFRSPLPTLHRLENDRVLIKQVYELESLPPSRP